VNCFPKWLYLFTFPPAVYENSNSVTFLPTLHVSRSQRCVVITHCGLNLHFPNTEDLFLMWKIFSHTRHPYIFFCEVSVQSFDKSMKAIQLSFQQMVLETTGYSYGKLNLKTRSFKELINWNSLN